ncbi:MAG TPA: hypothetical protein VMU39_20175 [Solirubrobacteraceae bacterium]|nr:hypothetical protein [Solirubrobacteraceae bacterium]
MSRRGSGALAAALTAATLMVSGCGSQALSDGQLATQATRLCQLATLQTDRIPTPTDPSDSALYLQRGIAVMDGELAQLRKLHAPDDVADVYTVSINSFAKKLSYMRDTVHDLAKGEDPVLAVRTLQQDLEPVEAQENGAWRTLQINACLSR